MADLVIDGEVYPMALKKLTHIGETGQIIIRLQERPDVFVALSPLAAQDLIDSLKDTIAEYRKHLDSSDEES